MQDSVSSVMERRSIAPLVRFERQLVEDKAASLQAGRAVCKDVDYAIVTPPYSKDEVFKKATTFIEDIQAKGKVGIYTAQQVDQFIQQYTAWKNGQSLPLVGTPIRGWSVLTPAQQENLIRVNIPTVEYLAEANEEGLRNIGMGALDMKRKALAWLSQAVDKGPLTQQIAAIQAENDSLKLSLDTLTRQVEALSVPVAQTVAPVLQEATSQEIGINDILDAPVPQIRRPKR